MVTPSGGSPVSKTTRKESHLSSKGQVVVHEEIRKLLGLESGTEFAVVAEGDVVLLKKIGQPSLRDFERLIETARRQALCAGMRRIDIAKAIARSRGQS